MEKQVKEWRDWTDSNGNVNLMPYNTNWGEHRFTNEEQERLLAGAEISFEYKGGVVTGHFQYYIYQGNECFGFRPNFDNQYDPAPIYHGLPQISTYQIDLQKEHVMAEYMRLNYYAKLLNKDKTPVDYQRMTKVEEQKRGVDVIYTQDEEEFLIDEKAQIDYIYNDEPLPTFALELLNSSSGAIGWFINAELTTQYYMFIWPHAVRGLLTKEEIKKKPLRMDDIKYVYFALVNKEKLQIEIEKKVSKKPKATT